MRNISARVLLLLLISFIFSVVADSTDNFNAEVEETLEWVEDVSIT